MGKEEEYKLGLKNYLTKIEQNLDDLEHNEFEDLVAYIENSIFNYVLEDKNHIIKNGNHQFYLTYCQ